MSKSKQLSNSFSTGSGGSHFEAHVQAYFVVLMLTDGYAPGLPCWPIMKIRLQGKIDGFETDDIVVFVEDPNSREQRRLLGQIKHSIAIKKSDSSLKKAIQAAWTDFQNPKVFKRKKNIIMLITGPLSGTDKRSVKWLLDQARYTQDPDEFFRNVQQAIFSSDQKREKLDVIEYHLKTANDDNEIKESELHDFLKCFYLLECDLGSESGVNLSLLHTLISQFEPQYPQEIWSRVVDIVQTYNQNAGTITRNNLPEDLIRHFKQKDLIEIPKKFKTLQEKSKIDWVQRLGVNAIYLALVFLIGAGIAFVLPLRCDRPSHASGASPYRQDVHRCRSS